ncbi:NUDIX domain-containing protein [Streptomyces sp. NPDC048172]|uniref:NUDIX hydrolase n=1 Tax=Streptomyces sp. NPDC048172 TaxID=3365505 RepID=UPI003714BBC6
MASSPGPSPEPEPVPATAVPPQAAAYLARHPAPLAAADALIRDGEGRLLLVDPTYKPGWDLPGGMLDDEVPHEALEREVREELGLGTDRLRVGRLLAVDALPREAYGRSLLAFVYAAHADPAPGIGELALQSAEIRAAAWVAEDEALERLPERLRRRVTAALAAERGAHTAWLHDGHPAPADGRDRRAMLPAPAMAVAAVVTDQAGRVLVVRRTRRGSWDLPGGTAHAQETPEQAAVRALAGELGLVPPELGRLLAVDSVPARLPDRAAAVHVFHVGPLSPEQAAAVLRPDGGVTAAEWLTPREAAARLPHPAGQRLRHGVEALAAGSIAHLAGGEVRTGSPVGVSAERRTEEESVCALSMPELIAQRPKLLVGAAVICTDESGRVLVVEPAYGPGGRWQLPGGGIDSDVGETPRQAAAREAREELGLPLRIGPLLGTDWTTPGPDPSHTQGLARITYLYDGGVLDAETLAAVELPPAELSSWRLVAPEGLDEVFVPRIAGRVRCCLSARGSDGGAVDLVDGRPYCELGQQAHPVEGLT